MRHLRYFILCLFLLILATDAACRAEEKWSNEVTGEVVIEGNLTADEAQRLCRNRAKAKAIEEVRL